MTKIPTEDRDRLENAFYLPMVLKVLERDQIVIEKSGVKLPRPYIELIEETMIAVQRELVTLKKYMRDHGMKVVKLKSDEAFTMYLFVYKGYEEQHNYFNPRIRNHVENLLRYYLIGRLKSMSPPSSGLIRS
ncbi:hypothetical protein [Jeotgalibacillus sp. JSM ZJ347]|uniref:hypothetical protein n=1 Tax=Jeotgalibacillus sp. JSM ZJ347 TaxID=3342117 RepID=UPI0035A900C6